MKQSIRMTIQYCSPAMRLAVCCFVVLFQENASAEFKTVSLESEQIKAVFTESPDGVNQQYFARDDGGWVKVLESLVVSDPFPPQGNRLYESSADRDHRYLLSDRLTTVAKPSVNRVLLSGDSEKASLSQSVSLDSGGYFRVETTVKFNSEKPRLDYVVFPTVFAAGKPDFVHVPAHKRNADNVISDRIFWAPAAIVQRGKVMAALVPNVDVINNRAVFARDARQHPDSNSFFVKVLPDQVSMPVALDLDLQSGLTDNPLLAYGVMDSFVKQHVFYLRDNTPGKMVRSLASNEVHFACELFVSAQEKPHRGYQRVSRHLWDKYGRKRLSDPRPQAMPYEEYARLCYPIYFDYQGYEVVNSQEIRHRQLSDQPKWSTWQQWQLNGRSVGGLRLTAPQWYDLIYFSSWWNNVCDATGMHYWGQRMNDATLTDKARRIVNLALSAPQNHGVFPSFYNVKENQWSGSLWRPPADNYDPQERTQIWNWENGALQPAACSTTAGFLLQYHKTCDPQAEIVDFVSRYAGFLLKNISAEGCVPGWFDEQLQPLPSMRTFNADGGVHTWVLAELYSLTKEPKYLDGARQLANFIIEKVMPNQNWADFESFYSCANKPEAYFDQHTGQPTRNLMSLSWSIMGLTSLYEITNDLGYLAAAEAVADYSGLYQAVWAPHFILTAYPFGGFAAQLGDAEWLDQRDHRFAGPLVKLGLLANRADLIERGVAAARASLTLVTHPRHKDNGIYMHSNFPLGLGPENIDHEGFPQMPLNSGPSWSSVGGLAAVAHVSQQLGSGYIDTRNNISIGVDGVRVQSSQDGRALQLKIKNVLKSLPKPYETAFPITLKIRGLTDGQNYAVTINEAPPFEGAASSLALLKATVSPNTVRVDK